MMAQQSQSFNPLRFGAPPPPKRLIGSGSGSPRVSIPFASGHLRHYRERARKIAEHLGFNPLRFGAPPPQSTVGDAECGQFSFNPLRFGAPPPLDFGSAAVYLRQLVSIPFASGHLRHAQTRLFRSGHYGRGFNPLRFGAPPPQTEGIPAAESS